MSFFGRPVQWAESMVIPDDKVKTNFSFFTIPKITTWIRVLLEKLTVSHLAKEFTAFHHNNTL